MKRVGTVSIWTLAASLCLFGIVLLAPAGTALAEFEPAGSEVEPPAPNLNATPPEVRPPARAIGASVARIITPTFARYRLGGRRGRLVKPETDWSGKPQWLLVLGSATHRRRDWLKVLLPFRPNRNTAWIPRDYVQLSRTAFWVEVRLASRRVYVYRNGRRVRTMRAVIGSPKTPTPLGLSAVHEINRQPDPRDFLGPWVVSLTSHSDVLMHFDGGPGRIGLHGRSGESLRDPLGSARSNGCIRVANRHITWLAKHLDPGTPVRVRR